MEWGNKPLGRNPHHLLRKIGLTNKYKLASIDCKEAVSTRPCPYTENNIPVNGARWELKLLLAQSGK